MKLTLIHHLVDAHITANPNIAAVISNPHGTIMKDNPKVSVYDLPTRIFHWLFAFLFLVAFIIAQTVDDDSGYFSLHMLAGLTIGFLLILRLVWGFIGTTYARFSSFRLSPKELLHYFKDVIISKTKRYLGHNPASSYAAIVMFIAALGLAATGIAMTGGYENDFYEEIHEVLANLFLIAVIAHVGGIIFHQIKHRDSLWSSMMDGKKKPVPNGIGIKNSKRITGIVFLTLVIAWAGYLFNNFDRPAQTLDLFGYELSLYDDHEEDSDYGEVAYEEINDD